MVDNLMLELSRPVAIDLELFVLLGDHFLALLTQISVDLDSVLVNLPFISVDIFALILVHFPNHDARLGIFSFVLGDPGHHAVELVNRKAEV